jgi:hypothetical protein
MSHHDRHHLRVEEQSGSWEPGVVAVAQHVAQLLHIELLRYFGIMPYNEDGNVLAVRTSPLDDGCHIQVPPVLVQGRDGSKADHERGLRQQGIEGRHSR